MGRGQPGAGVEVLGNPSHGGFRIQVSRRTHVLINLGSVASIVERIEDARDLIGRGRERRGGK